MEGKGDPLDWTPGSLSDIVRKQEKKGLQDGEWQHMEMNWISEGAFTFKRLYPVGWRHSFTSYRGK